MKKLFAIATAGILSLSLLIPTVSANIHNPEQEKKVTLTEAQKEEIAKLHKEVYEKKKAVIAKYVEYGVFTEEKGKFILDKMEMHMKELEDNGYVPRWDKHHKHPHHKK